MYLPFHSISTPESQVKEVEARAELADADAEESRQLGLRTERFG